MTGGSDGLDPRAVLLDIEGTTTPISFVHAVLFPYARARLAGFLAASWDEPVVADITRRLLSEHEAPADRDPASPPLPARGGRPTPDATADYFEWLMDRDRKSPALKELQGLIWEGGYRAGDLRGDVFPDVAPAIRRWRAAGRDVAIYSSGSELAQRRLFESIPDGDLTPLLSGFFDTRVGAKGDAASYATIARALGRSPGDVLFLSDVTLELSAARSAGCQAVLVVRPGNAPQPGSDAFQTVESFAGLA